MKYVMENDETSMSPELTQDHSGDVQESLETA